jgi:hypothetical protein
MTTKKFETILKNGIESVANYITNEGLVAENVHDWCGHEIKNVLHYAAQSQHCQELQLRDNGHEREFTFMSDLSVAEWMKGFNGVLEYFKQAAKEWKDDEHAMAEFVLSVNWKAWEMNARSKRNWAIFYSVLYEVVRDLVYDYYENDEEKVSYVYDYLD